MSAIGVLFFNQFVGSRQDEIRIAESFHDKEGLRVAGHASR
jgi:hypothetical protein